MRSAAFALSILLVPQLVFAQSRATEDGAALEHRLQVHFTDLPATWKAEQQVMDTIWRPLGLRGVNHYAYGAPVPPKKYAARSDPSSALYQAWFGVYTVVGDSAFRLASGKNYAIESLRKLAEYDQRSWLAAMGDPHPLAESDTIVQMQTITIDGVPRTLCLFHMRTHSDLNPGTTPLAQYIGMPPVRGRQRMPSYHPVVLHGYYVFWYDRKRDATIIAYAASSQFVPFDLQIGRSSPKDRDNGVELDKQFHEMFRGIHIVDAPGGK
jgi:hypothetical protein